MKKWNVVMRGLLLGVFATGVAAVLPAALRAQAAPAITVYKSPTCGCCGKWVEHAQRAGAKVRVHDISWEQLDAKLAERRVPKGLESCHVSVVGGYTVVGHVPMDVVQRMLKERPRIAGIAVPGMPMGSPGMEQGMKKDRYEVLSFTADGQTRVYDRR